MNANRVQREPIFNAPPVVTIFAATLVGIHLLRQLLPFSVNQKILFYFAFIPDLISAIMQAPVSFLSGILLWSPITYGLLHASWMHVIINSLWLIAFGAPVAIRFGTARFLFLCVLSAIAGALAYYLAQGEHGGPMIGASAVISGLTGAALRFAFENGGSFLRDRTNPNRFLNPAPPLSENLRNPQVLAFVVAWFAINFVFGAGPSVFGPGGGPIAWQAHIGGFLAGLIVFSLIDPVNRVKK